MVEVKPVRISCSSEDPAFPAINLLHGAYRSDDERKQWRSLSCGENSAFVILSYAEPFTLSSMELKNAGSAFVQVEGKNSLEPTDYKVLWKSNFMSAPESTIGVNIDGAYSFLAQDIPNSERNNKWDTLKIVCSQPFSKTLRCGLSHIISRTSLPVKEEKPEIPRVLGGLPTSVITNIKSENTSLPSPSTNGVKSEGNVAKTLSPVKQEASKSSDNCITRTGLSSATCIVIDDHDDDDSDEDDEDVNAIPVQGSSNLGLKHKCTDPDGTEAPKRLKPSVVYKPFNKLFEGVQIVISGFVNPQRAEIRSRALKLGATYSPQWSETSTHLICAFLYTPKYRQALGEGLIVSRNWVDQCYLQRKRLPWRRFALNMSERYTDGSETEIWELLPITATSESPQLPTEDQTGEGTSSLNNNHLLVPKIEPDTNLNINNCQAASSLTDINVVVKTEECDINLQPTEPDRSNELFAGFYRPGGSTQLYSVPSQAVPFLNFHGVGQQMQQPFQVPTHSANVIDDSQNVSSSSSLPGSPTGQINDHEGEADN